MITFVLASAATDLAYIIEAIKGVAVALITIIVAGFIVYIFAALWIVIASFVGFCWEYFLTQCWSLLAWLLRKGVQYCQRDIPLNDRNSVPFTIGDQNCLYNARSSRFRCAVNPHGPCQGCPHFQEKE